MLGNKKKGKQKNKLDEEAEKWYDPEEVRDEQPKHMDEEDLVPDERASESKADIKPIVYKDSRSASPLLPFKSKPRSEGDFGFALIKDEYSTFQTLVDSCVYLLARDEKTSQLAEDPDVADLLAGSPAGALFQEYLKTIAGINDFKNCDSNKLMQLLGKHGHGVQSLQDMLASLALSLKVPLLESNCSDMEEVDTLEKIAYTFLVTFLENNSNADLEVATLSNLLVCLMYRDLFPNGSSDSIVKELQTVKEDTVSMRYSDEINGQFKTLFAGQLLRLVQGDNPENFEVDELTEQTVEGFRKLVLTYLKKDDSAVDSLKRLNQIIDFPSLGASYSRFDILPSFCMGLITVDLDFTCHISRRNLLYFLPNGKKFKIKKLALLSSIEIPSIEEEQEENFKYPTVLDAVAKLEAKEKFAVSDYDWIQLTYNVIGSSFQWFSAHQTNNKSFDAQTNMNLYFSYNSKFTNLKKSVIIPLSDIPDQTAWNAGRECMFDLFVTDDATATVNDLLNFVSERIAINGIEHVTLKIADFELKLLNSKKVVRPKSDSQSIVDFIASLDKEALKQAQEGQVISYICIVNSRDLRKKRVRTTQNISVNLSKEEMIKMNRFNNNDMLKCNPTSFFEFFFSTVFNDKRLRVMGQHYYGAQRTSFWLPNVLIVDVSKLATSLIDPKRDLDLTHFKMAVQEMSMQSNSKYLLKGLICLRTPAGQPSYYYPVTMTGLREPCISHAKDDEESALSDVDDVQIKFAVYLRAESE